MTRPQHFGWFFSRGFGPQGWGHPHYDWDYRWTEPKLYQQSVRELEQAGFDLVIIEDALSIGTPTPSTCACARPTAGRSTTRSLLAPYLFDATEHLGIAPTVNAGLWPPYLAARQFATLQHLSRNRVGINVVTDVSSTRHFGADP